MISLVQIAKLSFMGFKIKLRMEQRYLKQHLKLKRKTQGIKTWENASRILKTVKKSKMDMVILYEYTMKFPVMAKIS